MSSGTSRTGSRHRDVDEIDLAICEILARNPRTPVRAISAKLAELGYRVSKSTVARRIAQLPERESVAIARRSFVSLLHRVFKGYEKLIREGHYPALRDIAYGSGALRPVSRQETRDVTGDDGDDLDSVVERFDRHDTATLQKMLDRLAGRGGSDPSGPGEEIPADADLDSGSGSSPDA